MNYIRIIGASVSIADALIYQKRNWTMKKKSAKSMTIGFIVAAVFVAIDQLTKYLAAVFLKTNGARVLIPGVFELRYLENQSAAFGFDIVTFLQRIFKITYFEANPDAFLRFKMGVFCVLTLIVVVLLGLIYRRIPQGNKRFYAMDAILIAFTAGAIGNCIDRVVHNYVIDFFYFSLINFPIFNVADIYVTVSAFLMIVFGLFYYKEDDFEAVFPSKKKKTVQDAK